MGEAEQPRRALEVEAVLRVRGVPVAGVAAVRVEHRRGGRLAAQQRARACPVDVEPLAEQHAGAAAAAVVVRRVPLQQRRMGDSVRVDEHDHVSGGPRRAGVSPGRAAPVALGAHAGHVEPVGVLVDARRQRHR
ncbi:hypothetical protein Phou_013080 [Phytohabitans houttuyneae]|uniref:Uncharacterized protein n=1 Tax=Phytohabitans houttuyneae TaxID=1076126 RepID=A0A6V8K499_9ACTN|nr:hypothetical protein Phou_013080 [Phytohabitans houttuyneae]